MSKKKLSRDEQIEIVQEKISEARSAKLALIESRKKINKNEEESRVKFQEFWALNKIKYNTQKDIEPILWAHLKAAGFTTPEKFEAGIENFGLKKK